MIIYLIFLVPFATAVFLWARYRHKMAWFEYFIFAVPLLLIVLAKGCTESMQVTDTEYWGGIVHTATYYEDWDERVSCRHPIPCTHYDEDGDPIHSNDGYEHLYDVDHHPEYWEVVDSNKASWRIAASEYERLVQLFGGSKFKELNRDYHSKDGDAYVATWPRTDATIEPTTATHWYENRIQASDSVFRFKDVDRERQAALYQYPKITSHYKSKCVLVPAGVDASAAEKQLMLLNAKLGAAKKVRMFILVFRDQPLQTAFDQEAFWQGGNKNEFIVMVGINANQEVQWAHVASWTDAEMLKVKAREFAQNQPKLDLLALANWLGDRVQQETVIRKDFREFAYLTVEPPLWAVISILLVTLVVCVLLAIWAINNELNINTSIAELGHDAYYF